MGHKINLFKEPKPLRHTIAVMENEKRHTVTYSEKYLQLIKKQEKEGKK